jgi:hypothetical protein
MASEVTPASGVAVSRADASTFDTSVAHVARVYNYWLGGKDNFAADRAAAEQAIAAFPDIVLSARANRAFLRRSVTYLVSAGIRQFLDIGTGIPSANNTHEVAQRLAPECRIVYVDNDPVVLAHARALLTSTPEGATSYIEADLRSAEQILETAAETLDFGQPVAIMLMAILQHLSDADDPYGVVGRLLSALPAGSCLALSHPARDIHAAEMAEMAKRLNQMMAEAVTFRSWSTCLPGGPRPTRRPRAQRPCGAGSPASPDPYGPAGGPRSAVSARRPGQPHPSHRVGWITGAA